MRTIRQHRSYDVFLEENDSFPLTQVDFSHDLYETAISDVITQIFQNDSIIMTIDTKEIGRSLGPSGFQYFDLSKENIFTCLNQTYLCRWSLHPKQYVAGSFSVFDTLPSWTLYRKIALSDDTENDLVIISTDCEVDAMEMRLMI